MPNPKVPITQTLAPKTAVILVAAGSGQRFGGNKIWAALGNRPVIAWSLQTFLDLAPECLVLVGSGDLAAFEGLDARPYAIVAGGDTRRASVQAGLAALPDAIDQVLIHDAARPGIDARTIVNVSAALKDYAAALPVLPLVDTIRSTDPSLPSTLNRSKLHAAQTPQGFALGPLLQVLKQSSQDETDEIQAMERAGHGVATVPGTRQNQKLTTQEDLVTLTALLTNPPLFITGSGFDVHRFCTPDEAEDRTLVLGGLAMPGERPLAGHSDADVLLHALCDAIYGALGDGDIGKHFPPSEASWKDQDSTLFLRHAMAQIAARGGSLVHCDLTLICEEPKLRPVEDAMKTRLMDLTGLSAAHVGLKATTTEQLGFTGRKEGIAAQATVTLRLPA